MNFPHKPKTPNEASRSDAAIISVAVAVAVLGTMMSIHGAAAGWAEPYDGGAGSAASVVAPAQPSGNDTDRTVPRARDIFNMDLHGDSVEPAPTF